MSPNHEVLWAELMALPGMHWVYRASESYEDLEHTIAVATGVSPLSFKALGNNIPNVSDLDWQASLDYTTEQVWYKNFGPRPAYVDRGAGDQYVRFVNGLASNYESQPGQLSPWEGAGEDFHLIHCFRPMPGASFEGSIGSLSWKNKAGNGNQITLLYSGETDAVGPDGKIAIWGQDNIVEMRVFANGDVELWLNGESIIETTFAGIVTGGIKELILGTNSHVMAKHFRAVFIKRGAHFSSDELATIYANTDALWPRGAFPNFPYLDGQYANVSTSWNGGTKTWAPPTGTFSGGNGVEGEHLYQWYYWRSNDSTFNYNNKLDAHLPIPGATGATLTRTDYEAGNAAGNPVIFDNPGSGEVSVMRLVTPRDSTGLEGERLPGQWALDNIP